MRILMMLLLLFTLSSMELRGQEPPPRPLNVTLEQDLGFGAFYHYMAGGTVTINTAGARQATGDVVLLGLGIPFSAAQFRLTGRPGTVYSILTGPPVLLTGSNGGTLTLNVGPSSPSSPFVLPAGPMQLYLGGTLTVGTPAANPPGNYSGTFDITFIQE